ncbi:hypothetical protein HPB51_013523 [Rhipicephalus microplus]|uniref:Uncharacterized protein n=1 Tax=Rhipicephalus microplus TaxID=6941 RepID=A0A9J6ET15_RHIMP|nr:hypothetical protein HPB51_013523 [Rhipicephalus microplus]
MERVALRQVCAPLSEVIRQAVELSLDCVVNANEHSVVELLGQQDYLRQGHVSPTQCRRPCMLRGESPRKVTSTTRRSPCNRPRLEDSARQAVELSVFGVINNNERSVIELLDQQDYLRRVT